MILHNKVFNLLAILTFVSVLSSCDHTTQPNLDTRQILPLVVSNSWTYARTWSRLDSTVVDTVTMSITSKDTVQGVVGYNVNNLIIGPILWFDMFMIDNRIDGLYMIKWPLTIPPTIPSASKALSFPTNVGETNSFEGYLITTESIEQPVTVKAGTFQCVKYLVRLDTNVVGLIWSQPGVGFVRTWAQYGLVNYTHELTSYSLK